MTAHRKNLAELLQNGRSGPIVCHVDLFGAAPQVNAGYRRDDILRAHVANVMEAAAGRALWVPTFNYDFPKTHLFDARTSPSQVGPFTEHFRKSVARWRIPVPMFSFAGTGTPAALEVRGDIDAFGANSIFAEIVQLDSTILFYGAGIISATILHHAESCSGGPLYRYEKSFNGTVTDSNGAERGATLRSHVRPLNKTLAYDAPKMARDLISSELLIALPEEQGRICAIGARQLVEFWAEKLRQDPFYLLDDASRQWIEPCANTLGRRFLISDFESDS